MTEPLSDEEQIRGLVYDWIEHTRSGNIEAVLDLMADDVVFLTPGQPPMIGRNAFARAFAAQGAGEMRAESTVQEISVHGDWAFIWTVLRVDVSLPGGASAQRQGPTLSILKRQNGKWRMFRDANMLAPTAP